MSAYPNRLRPLCVRTPSLRRAVALQDLISLQTGRSAKCFHLGLQPFGVGAPLGLNGKAFHWTKQLSIPLLNFLKRHTGAIG